jgi:hypothetical protein
MWTTWWTPMRRDAALAVLVLALNAVTVLRADDTGGPPMFPAGWALLVVSAGALVWRQRHPIPVFVVTSCCGLFY